MNDMSEVIQAKADELTADDLLSGPRTIKITGVDIRPGQERPVTISFEGDDGRPFKPCKTVSRILVNAWGADAKNYVGRSITLFRDPSVKWGGLAVGGLRPSHLSHIDRPLTMALTVTKGSKKATTVEPLKIEPTQQPKSKPAVVPYTPSEEVEAVAFMLDQLGGQPTLDGLVAEWKRLGPDIARLSAEGRAAVTTKKDDRKAELQRGEVAQ